VTLDQTQAAHAFEGQGIHMLQPHTATARPSPAHARTHSAGRQAHHKRPPAAVPPPSPPTDHTRHTREVRPKAEDWHRLVPPHTVYSPEQRAPVAQDQRLTCPGLHVCDSLNGVRHRGPGKRVVRPHMSAARALAICSNAAVGTLRFRARMLAGRPRLLCAFVLDPRPPSPTPLCM
jgi:hypothetical protein